MFFSVALLGRFDNGTRDGDKEQNTIFNKSHENNNDVEGHHPDFIIPVSVHVTDVNDNIPQFIGNTPYHLNISEVTLVKYPYIRYYCYQSNYLFWGVSIYRVKH